MSDITTKSELQKYILNGQMLGGLRIDADGSYRSIHHTPGGSANALDSRLFHTFAPATGSLIMAINAAANIAVNSGSTNATNIATNTSNIAARLPLAGGTMGGDIAMGSNSITGLADPSANQDAATKAYVDSQLTGADLDFQGDSGGGLSIDLDSETLTIAGGTGISTAGSGNTLTVTLNAATLSASAGGGIKMTNYNGSTAVNDLSLDIDGLAGGSSPHQTQDFFAYTDNGTEKKISFSNLEDAIFANMNSESSHVSVAAGGAITIESGQVTNGMLAGSIADSNLNTISTADKVSLSALDIDGATDIGTALADADLIVVDDGAGGTNRKAAMSRVASYVGTAFAGQANTYSAVQTFNSGTLKLKGTKTNATAGEFVLSVEGGIFKVSLAE